MKKCIIIGGGIAGLTAASYLVNNGIKVTILESSPKAGGRAYSFNIPGKNESVDNGQHLLMGCYKDTIAFLKMIGAKKNFIFQKRLEVNFINSNREKLSLKSAPLPYPLNLLIGFLRYNALSVSERLSVIRLMLKLPFIPERKLQNLTVSDWLISENQSEKVIKSFWELIAIGALNTNLDKASALIFKNILMKMFYNGNKASTIINPKYGLTECYVNNATGYIKKFDGEVHLSERVEKLVIENQKVASVKTIKNNYTEFDAVILAVQPYAADKLLEPELLTGETQFSYSSILNVHLWLKENPFTERFYGLLNSPVHWIFNKGSHINLVISDADYLMEKTESEIKNLCLAELEKYCNINQHEIIDYKIIKEKRATIIPSNKILYSRPSAKTKIDNLFLAGDWTDTGLPSTIESAAKSGRVAAELVLNNIHL